MLQLSYLLAAALYGHPGLPSPVQAAERRRSSITLSQYIDSLHWDASKQGPLIAIDAKRLRENDDSPEVLGRNAWSWFEQKLVRCGGLSAVAQSWEISLPDEDLPNAYESLGDNDKLTFLLATLDSSQLAKLTGDGITVGDLTGEQRAALQSMIPKPFQYTQGQANAGGVESHEGPKTLPPDQVAQLRLQVNRGMRVQYETTPDPSGAMRSSSISSFDFHGPIGTPVAFSSIRLGMSADSPLKGKVVPSTEKKSDLSWGDPRLAKPITLESESVLGDFVGAVRKQTGVDVYADSRIFPLKVNCWGTQASAADLLRGLALCIGGCIRKVGSAYVLTADREGSQSREIRLTARTEIGQAAIAGEISKWRLALVSRGILDSIPYRSDDYLGANQIPRSLFPPSGLLYSESAVPITDLPPAIGSAISEREKQKLLRMQASSRLGVSPPATSGPFEAPTTVHIYDSIGYRFVLPDGRPLQYAEFRPARQSFVEASKPNEMFPVASKSLPEGTAVGLRTDDAKVVTSFCTKIRDLGLSEIWLETKSAGAVQAAIDAHVKVDLVIHPWRPVPGEKCPDPDRNVLGLSGSQMNEVPALRFDEMSGRTFTYADSFAPGDPRLPSHWDRLIASIPSGIHAIILRDAEPTGYEQAETAGSRSFTGGMYMNGNEVRPGLYETLPEFFQFGYCDHLRERFLREHGIDPIDVKDPVFRRDGPAAPYFDQPNYMGSYRPYPTVHFPIVPMRPDQGQFLAWQSYRHDALVKDLGDLIGRLSVKADAIFAEDPTPRDWKWVTSPSHSVSLRGTSRLGLASDSFIRFVTVNPLNAEDPNGNLSYHWSFATDKPLCIDLSGVPADRLEAYLRYVFKT